MAHIPKESTIVNNILKYLNSLPQCYAEKTHGGAYGNAGKPDIVGCYRGQSFVFEVKRPGREKNLTDRQKHMLGKWKAAGAISEMVTSVDQVKNIIF